MPLATPSMQGRQLHTGSLAGMTCAFRAGALPAQRPAPRLTCVPICMAHCGTSCITVRAKPPPLLNLKVLRFSSRQRPGATGTAWQKQGHVDLCVLLQPITESPLMHAACSKGPRQAMQAGTQQLRTRTESVGSQRLRYSPAYTTTMLSNPWLLDTILCDIRHGGTNTVSCGPSCPPRGPEGHMPLNPSGETCWVSRMS